MKFPRRRQRPAPVRHLALVPDPLPPREIANLELECCLGYQVTDQAGRVLSVDHADDCPDYGRPEQ